MAPLAKLPLWRGGGGGGYLFMKYDVVWQNADFLKEWSVSSLRAMDTNREVLNIPHGTYLMTRTLVEDDNNNFVICRIWGDIRPGSLLILSVFLKIHSLYTRFHTCTCMCDFTNCACMLINLLFNSVKRTRRWKYLKQSVVSTSIRCHSIKLQIRREIVDAFVNSVLVNR